MANTFLRPTVIVATALGLLQREIVLPKLVWTDAQGNSPLGSGDTFSIRVPATTAARTRVLRGAAGVAAPTGRQIITDTLTETKIDVTLNTDIYNSIAVTDEELSLDIVDFGIQVLAPQVRAVAEGLENGLAEAMQDNAPVTTVVLDPATTGSMFGGLIDARKALNDANVPMAGRSVVVGSALEAAILKDPQFSYTEHAGDSNALRDAQIGRIAGFDIYTSNALDPNEGYAFHKTAYVMTMRAPNIPAGATFGSSQSYLGLAMRWLRDYDYANVQDRSLVDSFVGYAIVPDGGSFVRSVRLELASASIVILPVSQTIAVAGTIQASAKAANGSVVDVNEIAWTTSDATKATVSAGGLITGVASGSATITGTYQTHTDTVVVTVS